MKRMVFVFLVVVLVFSVVACRTPGDAITPTSPPSEEPSSEPTMEPGDERDNVTGTYNGQIDSNSIEMNIDGEDRAVVLGPDLRETFEDLGLQGGERIRIFYTMNEHGQMVVQEIAILEREAGSFSLMLPGGGFISIMEWDNQVDLTALLGEPVQQTSQTVGPGGDTFEGSFLRYLFYGGLEMEWMSPPGNGESFYLLSMTVESDRFSTYPGARTGDRLEEVRSLYPSMQRIEDSLHSEADSAYRHMEDHDPYYIYFFFRDGVLGKIIIGFELQ